MDYVMAQPSFISSVQDLTIGPRPVGVAVDHALMSMTISFQFSVAHMPRVAAPTRYTFTRETASVYIDGIYKPISTKETGHPLEELTSILTQTLHDAAVEAYPHTQPE